MNSLVSIIIPFYNTDCRHFLMCIKSLIHQTYLNLEIIIVNDGSKQIFTAFLDEIVLKDKRIKLFHKPNGGVSSARNYAISNSTGDYIIFVDSDDWVEPNFVESLVTAIRNNNADIAVVELINEHNGSNTPCYNSTPTIEILNQQQMYNGILNYSNIGGYLCNKIFIKKIITHKLNESYHYCEDFVYIAEYLKVVQKGVFVHAKLYHYRHGEGNASSNFSFNEKILTLIDAYKNIEQIYSVIRPTDLPRIRKSILKQGINIYARYKINHINQPQHLNKLKSVISEYWDAYKCASLADKINMRLTLSFPLMMFKFKLFLMNSSKC